MIPLMCYDWSSIGVPLMFEIRNLLYFIAGITTASLIVKIFQFARR